MKLKSSELSLSMAQSYSYLSIEHSSQLDVMLTEPAESVPEFGKQRSDSVLSNVDGTLDISLSFSIGAGL